MKNRKWHAKGWPATPMLAALITLGLPAVVHATPTQNGRSAVQDSDITRQELAQFDQFLDGHREIAEQVRRDPSLVNNDQFVRNHPALQTFMQQHPTVREELKENPNAFMHQEARYDRSEDRMRDERVRFDRFLDGHREIAEQLRKNPKLINDEAYVKGHPELQTYLQDHPELRQAVRNNPDPYVRQGEGYDRRADNGRQDKDNRDRDARRDNDARDRDARADNDNRDRDARRDNDARDRDARPDNDARDRDARADNDTRDPDARADKDNRDRDARQDNDARARQDNDNRDRDARADNDARDRDARRDNDNRYKQRDADDRDRDARRDELANFDHYLDSHRETAEQIRKNPSLVNNDEFVKNHPSLQSYLQEHPEVRTAIKQDPNAFMQQEARYDQNEYRMRGQGDEPHRHFGEFLGGHSNISEQLSKDPSLVKNQEYMQNHPELKDYLNQHPDVRQGLMQNPETFVKSSQQFNTNNKNGTYSGAAQTPATSSKPADATKPKQ